MEHGWHSRLVRGLGAQGPEIDPRTSHPYFDFFPFSCDPRSYERKWAIEYVEAWKIQDFNGVWTRDLAMSARRSNQLSYEADVDKSALQSR